MRWRVNAGVRVGSADVVGVDLLSLLLPAISASVRVLAVVDVAAGVFCGAGLLWEGVAVIAACSRRVWRGMGEMGGKAGRAAGAC